MAMLGDIGAGHRLGSYELLAPIAVGGMATIWAARAGGNEGLHQVVAIKLMRTDLDDDGDFEEMFLDEAGLIAKIRHPNVVEILDLGEQNGVLFQVMEFVDGEPMNIVLRESKAHGGLPVEMGIHVVKKVCAALHAAHEQRDEENELLGLVHRDVSPDNILVTHDGRIKLIDFGVAKAASNLQKTTFGQVKGKAAYMAPEQARGDKVDRRTDIFAVGIVFFQLVTGKHPFDGESEYASLGQIISRNPVPRASSLVPELPAELDDIIAKALEKDPEARFPSAAEMRRALERFLPGSDQDAMDALAAHMTAVVGERRERRQEMLRKAEGRSSSPGGVLGEVLQGADGSGAFPASAPLSPTAVPEAAAPAASGPDSSAPAGEPSALATEALELSVGRGLRLTPRHLLLAVVLGLLGLAAVTFAYSWGLGATPAPGPTGAPTP